MFCPNCGTQNPDTAAACSKCGFNLKGAAVPKFKGTMLMVNPPNAPAAAPPGAAPPAAVGPAAPAPVAAPPAAPAPEAAAAPPAPVKPQLKGTMLGVAPPGFGAPVPAPGAPAQPPAPAPNLGAPPAPAGVDPLGGTVVAGGGFGAAPNFGAAPGAPPAPAPGAPPAPGYAAPPAYGAPPAADPYGTPPGYGAQGSSGYGPPPGAPQAGLAPMGSAGFGGGPITQHGPVGPIRNAVVQYLIAACTCGLGAVYLTYTFANELNQFRQKNDVSFIMLLLIIGWLSIPEKVIEAKRMAGIPNPSASNVILYLFFWPYFLTLDLNEIYTAAGAQS